MATKLAEVRAAEPDLLSDTAAACAAAGAFLTDAKQSVLRKVSRGDKVDSFVWIPFELVTRENYKSFLDR